MTIWTFKTSKGRLWHSGAIAYSLLTYSIGWYCLLVGGSGGFLPGVLLLGHGMIIAAYMIHECAHNTIFNINRHNLQLGALLGWVCGSCYGTVEDIRTKQRELEKLAAELELLVGACCGDERPDCPILDYLS